MSALKLDRIVDTTLREGEQTPTVYFRPEEKCRIAELLHEALGRKGFIEAGQPYSPKYREGVEAVIKHFNALGKKDPRLLLHCRTLKEDVEIAAACGGWGVVVVLAPTEKHLLHKLNGLRYGEALERISAVVSFAKDSGAFRSVQYTLEDATSLPLQNLIEVSKVAEEAGADILRIPDTKGQADFNFFKNLISTLKENTRVPIDVHCHNDRGLAIANAIGGLQGGATGVHASVLGLGERNGIPDIASLMENLETLYGVDTGVEFRKLPELYSYVSAVSGVQVAPNAPIMGVFSRTHKAGEHQKSVLRCPETYETFEWSKFGLAREFEFGAMQSKELVDHLLGGAKLQPETKARVVQRIRDVSMAKGRPLRAREVWSLIEAETGITPRQTGSGDNHGLDAVIFLRVKPSCDELDLIKSLRQMFLEASIPVRIRDISGAWDFIIDAKGIRDSELLDRITGDIRRARKDIVDTSTCIVFDEYK
ncbi:MAG: LeuA family protein [Candidatus Bathyarchaeia archaeon]